jgi:hypothetical protein
MSRPVPRRPHHVPKRPGATAIRGVVTPGSKNDDGYLYVAGVKDPSKRMVEYRVGVLS